MDRDIWLEHLDLVQDPTPNLSPIMRDILGFGKVHRLFRGLLFRIYFFRALKILNFARSIDVKSLTLDPDLPIKYPLNIDSIPYMAMLEIRSLVDVENNMGYREYISEVITKACFSSNFKKDYDSGSDLYKSFRRKVLRSPLKKMLGLFNHIDAQLTESEKFWGERFFAVNVADKDFDNAGGNRMGQFNVVNTVKGICHDFNVTIDKAWQVPYALVQTNSLAKATYAHIENRMREIKEDRMRRERGRRRY